jgi:RimJ/RimL family protein N-acetyltransferase
LISIDETNQRSKRYDQSAIRQLIKYAFKDIGLMRLYLLTLADNKQAIQLFEKCGFVVEGKLNRQFSRMANSTTP